MRGWILLCVLLIASRISSAAPAPLPKPIQYHPASLVGIWIISWGSSGGEMALHPDGQYWCQMGDRRWIGTWKVDHGVIEIVEALIGDDGVPGEYKNTYRLIWDGKRTGEGSGVTVRFGKRWKL